jgi:hypothetical protein
VAIRKPFAAAGQPIGEKKMLLLVDLASLTSRDVMRWRKGCRSGGPRCAGSGAVGFGLRVCFESEAVVKFGERKLNLDFRQRKTRVRNKDFMRP